MDLSPFFLQINVFIDEKTINKKSKIFSGQLFLVLAAVIVYIRVCTCVCVCVRERDGQRHIHSKSSIHVM